MKTYSSFVLSDLLSGISPENDELSRAGGAFETPSAPEFPPTPIVDLMKPRQETLAATNIDTVQAKTSPHYLPHLKQALC